MKKVLFFSSLIIGMLMVSCASVDDEEFDKVYNKYKSQLIMDGAVTHTVKSGETLSGLSKLIYDEGMYYPVIMLASSDIVKDPDKIFPGAQLTIPNLDVNLNNENSRSAIKGVILDCANLEARRDRDSMAKAMRNFANSL